MTVTVDTTSTRYRVSVWRWTLSSTVSQFNSVTRQSSDTRLYWTVQNTYRYVNGSKLAQLFMLRYKVNTAYVIPYVCSCYHKHTMHCAIFSWWMRALLYFCTRMSVCLASYWGVNEKYRYSFGVDEVGWIPTHPTRPFYFPLVIFYFDLRFISALLTYGFELHFVFQIGWKWASGKTQFSAHDQHQDLRCVRYPS